MHLAIINALHRRDLKSCLARPGGLPILEQPPQIWRAVKANIVRQETAAAAAAYLWPLELDSDLLANQSGRERGGEGVEAMFENTSENIPAISINWPTEWAGQTVSLPPQKKWMSQQETKEGGDPNSAHHCTSICMYKTAHSERALWLQHTQAEKQQRIVWIFPSVDRCPSLLCCLTRQKLKTNGRPV